MEVLDARKVRRDGVLVRLLKQIMWRDPKLGEQYRVLEVIAVI
jgi:hypothetical protein